MAITKYYGDPFFDTKNNRVFRPFSFYPLIDLPARPNNEVNLN